MPDTKQDVLTAQEQLRKLKDLLDALEKIGVEAPELTKAVNRLQIAIDTGVDIGNAAAETSAVLAAHANDAYKKCGDDAVCIAKYDSAYQARNVNFVLNIDNPDSVVRKSIRATLQRYLPQAICDRLDSCRTSLTGQR
jgi:hypothetical protein